MMAKKQAMTAAELMAELANDGDYQKKLREKELQSENLERILDEDERQLVAECNVAGVKIRSVWDLVNTASGYSAVIPILVDHLDRDHHSRTEEGIVRALTTPEARGIAFTPLVRRFREISDGESEIKWLVGAAIAESATSDDAPAVVELIKNESHGRGREFLPFGLIQLPKERALSILGELSNHPVMGESAKKAISLLK